MVRVEDFSTRFAKMKHINVGSSDVKYYIESGDGESFFLRIAKKEKKKRKKEIYKVMQALFKLGIPMARPVEFGICEKGVYTITEWIEGRTLREVLSTHTKNKQYDIGWEAGSVLKRMHTIPAPTNHDSDFWQDSVFMVMRKRICDYIEFSLDIPILDDFLTKIYENDILFNNRPQYFLHGDFDFQNIMMDTAGKLRTIDFDGFSYGDPYKDFARFMHVGNEGVVFVNGLIHGYFNNNPPLEFWNLVASYAAIDLMGFAIRRRLKTHAKHKKTLKMISNFLYSFDQMRSTVPNWYKPV